MFFEIEFPIGLEVTEGAVERLLPCVDHVVLPQVRQARLHQLADGTPIALGHHVIAGFQTCVGRRGNVDVAL